MINVVVEGTDNKSESKNLQFKDKKNESVQTPTPAKEFGGRGGLEPTRYGDWEKNGRCIDF